VVCTEFNTICEPAPSVSGDDTFAAVNRLLAEYLARSAEGLVDVRLDVPLAVAAIGGESGLLEAHGGRIEARSDGPGKGTEFILELPAC